MINVRQRPNSQLWVSLEPSWMAEGGQTDCLSEDSGKVRRSWTSVSWGSHPYTTLSTPVLRERYWVVKPVRLAVPMPGPSFPLPVGGGEGSAPGGGDGGGGGPPFAVGSDDTLLGILISGYLKEPSGGKPEELDATDDRLVRDLASIGHTVLARKLQGKTGMIWDSIRQVGSPSLMELLVDLYSLCRKKAGGEGKPLEALIKVMMFCLRIAKGAMPKVGEQEVATSLSRVDQLAIEEAHQHIGRVMYLANQDLLQVNEWIDPDDMIGTLKKIESEALARLRGISDSVRECFAQQLTTGLQDKERATTVRLSREMAKALLCDNGAINAGLINDLKVHVLDRWSSETPYQMHTSYVLAMLRNFPELRNKISKITRPEEKARNARSLIEVSLDLPPNAEIEDLHAKQTVLTALLSHLRQGRVGSCFASFLPIVLLAADLDTCLKDFTDLVQGGQLVRFVDGSPVPFPFRLRMSRERLGKILTMDHWGKAVSETGAIASFWDNPGIKAACRVLGIEQAEEAGKKVLEKLLLGQESHTGDAKSSRFFPTTIEGILRGLVEYAVDLGIARPQYRANLFSRAVFAFESQTSCALQRVWESVIADMAEATEHGFIKPQIIDCILFSMERKLRVVCKGKKEIFDAVIEAMRHLLRGRIRLVFDPTLKGLDENADGHSSQGGFVLCDGSLPFSPLKSCNQVEDPKDFQEFASRTLEAVKERLRQRGGCSAEELDKLFQDLQAYARTDLFVLQAIKKCSPLTVDDPIKDFAQMDITPWCFRTGANYKNVLPTYFGMSGVPRISSFYCRNATSLLERVLKTVREHQFWIQKSHSPRKVIPGAAHGLHVFSIMLDHPSIEPALKVENLQGWLAKNVEEPGLKVAQSQVDPSTRLELLAFCFSSFSPDIEGRSAFYSDLIDIPYKCSIKEYRDKLLSTIIRYRSDLDDEGKAITTLSLDTALIAFLPKLQRELIQNSAIHFGDTHWQTGLRDIHFGVGFNPGSCRLELCEINDDNSDMKTLDQVYWLQARDWEVCSFVD